MDVIVIVFIIKILMMVMNNGDKNNGNGSVTPENIVFCLFLGGGYQRQGVGCSSCWLHTGHLAKTQ